MDIIKDRGKPLYALFASLFMHAGIFLSLLSLSSDEVLRGDIFFLRLIAQADITEKGNPAGEALASPATRKKELLRERQSEISIRDRESDSETLLNEFKTVKQNDLEPPQGFSPEEPDRTIPSEGAGLFNSREDLSSPGLSLKGDEGDLSKGEALSRLNSTEGPSILELIKPLYPSLARRLGKEGTVLLRIHIDELGRPVKVDIIKKAGFGLDEAALNAIKLSRFRPAIRDGIPVSSVVIVPVRFVLEK